MASLEGALFASLASTCSDARDKLPANTYSNANLLTEVNRYFFTTIPHPKINVYLKV